MLETGGTCGFVRGRLEIWAREGLAEADRRAVTDHLAVCEPCRQEAARVAPAALFLGLRGAPMPGGFWHGFDARLRARIEAESAQPAPARLAGRFAAWLHGVRESLAWASGPAVWAAPAAMLLVLGAVVGVLRHDTFMPGPRSPRVEALPSPYAPPGGGARTGAAPAGPAAHGIGTAPEGSAAVIAALPALVAGSGEPPALEEVASPSARVYRFDAAEGGSNPIYLVVDESIEF